MSIQNEPTFSTSCDKKKTPSSSSKFFSPIREKHSAYRRRHDHRRKHYNDEYIKKKSNTHDHSTDYIDLSSDLSEQFHFLRKSKNKIRHSYERASPSYEPYENSTSVRCNQNHKKSSSVRHTSSRSPHSHHTRHLKTSSRHKSSQHKKERLLRPETSILAMIIKDQVRTNDRMDREEVKRATIALRELDPTTTDQARLMTEYLASACSKRL